MTPNTATAWDEIYNGLARILVEALGVDSEAVKPNATLRDDLAAESIDFLDIFFRIERKFGVTFSKKDFTIGLASDEWDSRVTEAQLRQNVSPADLERLRQMFPEVDPAKIAPGLTYADLGGLFTVTTLVNFVMAKMNAKKTDAS